MVEATNKAAQQESAPVQIIDTTQSTLKNTKPLKNTDLVSVSDIQKPLKLPKDSLVKQWIQSFKDTVKKINNDVQKSINDIYSKPQNEKRIQFSELQSKMIEQLQKYLDVKNSDKNYEIQRYIYWLEFKKSELILNLLIGRIDQNKQFYDTLFLNDKLKELNDTLKDGDYDIDTINKEIADFDEQLNEKLNIGMNYDVNAAKNVQQQEETKQVSAQNVQQQNQTKEVSAQNVQQQNQTKEVAAKNAQQQKETKQVSAKNAQQQKETKQVSAQNVQQQKERNRDKSISIIMNEKDISKQMQQSIKHAIENTNDIDVKNKIYDIIVQGDKEKIYDFAQKYQRQAFEHMINIRKKVQALKSSRSQILENQLKYKPNKIVQVERW